jgi:spermidine dehydrogenase
MPVAETTLGGDCYSAVMGPLGTQPYLQDPVAMTGYDPFQAPGEYFDSFPTGNSGVARWILSKFMPAAFKDGSWSEIVLGSLNWDALDRRSSNVRIRVNSTVIGLRHEGRSPGVVVAYYLRDGQMHAVRAKTAIAATPQHVSRNIVLDLPPTHSTAMAEYHHGPMLKVNVAVRNWTWMEKAGMTSFRWFGDYPTFGILQRAMKIDGRDVMPCDPRKPAMIPMYIPMNNLTRGMPFPEQAFVARRILYGMPYSQIETTIRSQFNKLFASYGFDDKRDIAAIIANRWGHAIVCAGKGFFSGKNGKPPAMDTVRQPHGRIAFASADIGGEQSWTSAASEARRAVQQVLGLV